MEYILKNGIVYDPTNKVAGEKKDVMINDGKIVVMSLQMPKYLMLQTNLLWLQE